MCLTPIAVSAADTLSCSRDENGPGDACRSPRAPPAVSAPRGGTASGALQAARLASGGEGRGVSD
jgi:hypothetical protein